MTRTTDEYWSIDEHDLNTMAFNIETLGGRWRSAPLRGENLRVPNRPGSVWVPKVPDEKVLTLAMWVQGITEAGVTPSTNVEELARFNANWRKLLQIFSVRSRLMDLTKRWYDTPGAATIKSAVAKVEPAGFMDLEMIGRKAGRFVVELNVPDPYFYGASVTTNITTIGQTTSVENPGDDLASSLVIRFNGPLTNPTLSNAMSSPATWVKYSGTLAANQWVELDVAEFVAKKHDGSNVIGAITHNGAKRWMELYVGPNNLMLTTDAGGDTGNATVAVKAPYF